MLSGRASHNSRSHFDSARQEGAARKPWRAAVYRLHLDLDCLPVEAILLKGNGEFIPWALLESAGRHAALSERRRCARFTGIRLELKLNRGYGRNTRAAAKGDCDNANAN